MFNIRAVITGDLERWMEAEARHIRDAANKAVRGATEELKGAARAEVDRGLGGKRVSNAIRARYFRGSGGDITGTIYSKFGVRRNGRFEDFLLPHILGGEQRPRRGGWLLVPILRRLRNRSFRGDKLRAWLATQKGIAFIRATSGPRAGRMIYIVKQTRTRSHLLAVLVKQVRLRKRVDFAPVLARHEASFPGRLAAEIARDD